MLQRSPTRGLPGSLKNMATEDEQRRDCAVLCSAKLLRGYSNAQAGDALGFAEAIEDMFARFPVHSKRRR
jgi:hypothetical protein